MTAEFQTHRDNQRVCVEMWVVDLLDGDLAAALLFSQLLWWFQPAKGTREVRARYERNGERWLVRADDDWWDDCRLTQRQVRRVRKILQDAGLIEHRKFKWEGAPTSAWRPVYEAIEEAISANTELPPEGHFLGTNASASLPTSAPASLPIDTELRHKPEHTPNASDPVVDELCQHLANRMAGFHGEELRPAISKTWLRDMDLLLRHGGNDVAKPGPVDPQVIHRAIDYLFDDLATPEGPTNFCWAGVIKSPTKLRKHWRALASEKRTRSIGRVNKNTRNVMRATMRGGENGHAGIPAPGPSDAARLFSGELAAGNTTKETN